MQDDSVFFAGGGGSGGGGGGGGGGGKRDAPFLPPHHGNATENGTSVAVRSSNSGPGPGYTLIVQGPQGTWVFKFYHLKPVDCTFVLLSK